VLLGGGAVEVATAGALAMLTGWVAAARLLPEPLRRFHEPFAAFVVSLAVSALATACRSRPTWRRSGA
jgi:hypothetical protein